MATGAEVEYMAYPRACALADALWSPATAAASFSSRLRCHMRLLRRAGVNFRRPDGVADRSQPVAFA